MEGCKFLGTCIFFNQTVDSMTEMLKKKYCLNDFSGCARFMIATQVGREKVPKTMYPNMLTKAQTIILENK